MGSGRLDVESMKHSCGSAAGVEEVSVDVVVEGVGGLGIRGGGTSSDGSFEVINSNNGDGGGVQVTCFTEVLEDVTLHFQIIRLHKQIYAWIGCNSAKFGRLYAAAPTRPKQHKKGISSSGHQCERGFAIGQLSYDYFQVGCSTSVGVQETFDEGYHLKMLFSGEVVEPRYDEEEASIFSEEDMEENCGQEQDCSQALCVCDENFPVFDQDDEPNHDQDVAIFDDDSEVLDYEEVDVCEYEEVDACEYEGVAIFDNYDDEDDPLVEHESVHEDEEHENEILLTMKEVVLIQPSIPFLYSMKIMVESHDTEVTWLLNERCFQEMPLMLSSKPFIPLRVGVDEFILGPCEKHYLDNILLPKWHATWVVYSHLNMASPQLEDKLFSLEGKSDVVRAGMVVMFSTIRSLRALVPILGFSLSNEISFLIGFIILNNTVSVTNILGGSSDNTGSGIARRLVLKTGLNVILACNIPNNSPMLEADAEKKLVEKLIDLGYTRPKSNGSSS
ncbi:hypothetical protein TEA_001819 [Camellia sinensis var. sinensis]|uniref:Proteasome assembly chaperone 4 n=1 Tax=Camellia sinensis var. sinensis TaxID=542762 RepID=A0A4S4ESZ4_CAMSN|nr:hypothetical protein TEA_001819 [Camellia sinensis var. sinensis]